MIEQDRYLYHSKLYVTGMFCLISSLSLLAFSFFILPFLIWSWDYDVPSFILLWQEWFVENYAISPARANALIFLIFFIPAILTGVISGYISNLIDNDIFNIHPAETEDVPRRNTREMVGFGLKVFIIMALVIIAVFMVEWLIEVPPANKQAVVPAAINAQI